jgi:mono/diheme cytochrome c family protein
MMAIAASLTVGVLLGCNAAPPMAGTPDDTTAAVQNKAETVARQVGGTGGYGGTLMNGYFDHAPAHMGFVDGTSLADDDGMMTVRLTNDTDFDCTFNLNYFASHMGLIEQSDSVDVPAGEQVDFDMPCAEIVGLGNLESPGATGCILDDGQPVPNTMAVPGFLGLDYACGGMHAIHLAPDTDDLDGNGDTEELVLTSDALDAHMRFGGPTGHSHRPGGMFGGHGHFNAPNLSDLPDDATNGESIFLTGTTLDGSRIAFEGGPPWLTVHGGGCASCHGTDGRGGHWVMMTGEVAPDIRYATLTEQHDDSDHEEEHPPYTDESLARAIRLGVNPAGEPLSTAMPRWNLSDADLADLIAYLKTLDESEN